MAFDLSGRFTRRSAAAPISPVALVTAPPPISLTDGIALFARWAGEVSDGAALSRDARLTLLRDRVLADERLQLVFNGAERVPKLLRHKIHENTTS